MNQLTEEEKQDNWQILFDGATPSKHWRGFRSKDFPDGWIVDNGTLHRADHAGDIITKEQFQNFELSLEWRVEGPGNSGIMFRVSEDEDRTFKTGPEYQILNNQVHPDGQNPLTRASANYGLHAPTKDTCKPVGEWNHTRIVVDGNHVEHWLNGEKVVDYELLSDDWEKRVAGAKFADWPRYGREPKGHIALQDHQDPVWYRNIKLRRL